MPLLSVFKAAFRFNQIHGNRRDYRPPCSPLRQEGGLMSCEKCGTTYLVNDIKLFIFCESCGGPLVIGKKVENKESVKIEKERRAT